MHIMMVVIEQSLTLLSLMDGSTITEKRGNLDTNHLIRRPTLTPLSALARGKLDQLITHASTGNAATPTSMC